jgi:hypothetical protein
MVGEAADAAEPPPGLSKMQQMKWKRDQKMKLNGAFTAMKAVNAFAAPPPGGPGGEAPGEDRRKKKAIDMVGR